MYVCLVLFRGEIRNQQAVADAPIPMNDRWKLDLLLIDCTENNLYWELREKDIIYLNNEKKKEKKNNQRWKLINIF